MTNINVPQNTPLEPHPEKAQTVKICYIIKLTDKEWRAHWKLMDFGNMMADFLRVLSESLLADSPHHELAGHLVKNWMEIQEPLRSVYEKADIAVVERSSA